jgi:hypothetical protein
LTHDLPNKTLPELHAMVESGALDALRELSDACREAVLNALLKVFPSDSKF